MHWMEVYGLISIGVAIGVTIMAILTIARDRDEPSNYNASNITTMDEADRASQEVERSLQEAIRARRPVGPVATGRCLWCDEIVGDGIRWCPDEECRDLWEQERRMKR